MVDLPTVGNNVPSIRAPESRVSAGAIASPYQELAANLDKAGEVLSKDVAVPLAEKAGAVAGRKAVTRDADGNLQVQEEPLVGDAAVAYSRTFKVAAVADGEQVARFDDIRLRQEHRDDPDGYLRAAKEYQKAKTAQYSKAAGDVVGMTLNRMIGDQTVQTYKGLVTEKERLDLARSERSITAQIDTAKDDLTVMARGGVTSGPDWDAAVGKVQTLINERVNNPRLAYPREQADYDLRQFHGELAGQGFLYHIDQIYKDQGVDEATKQPKGGAKNALTAAQSILTDQTINLTQAQREAFYHKAVGEVRASEALRHQDLTEARAAHTELTLAAASGLPIQPEQVEKVADAYRKAGDPAAASRLYAQWARKPLNDDFGRQPLDAQARQLAIINQRNSDYSQTGDQPITLTPDQQMQLQTQGGPTGALWLAANRARTIQTEARAAWKSVMEGWDKEGIRPPDAVINQIVNAAHVTGDHDLLETIAANAERMAIVQTQGRQPLSQQAASLGALGRAAQAGELAIGQQAIERDLQRRYNSVSQGLQKNPIATTVANFSDRFQQPAPLDFSNPQNLAGGLAQRAQIAGFAAANWKTGDLPALDEADANQMRSVLDKMDPAAKAGLYGLITNSLPAGVREATLAKLGSKGPEAMVEAFAGGLHSYDPNIAESILRGQQAVKTDKRFDPRNEGEKKKDFDDALDKALPEDAFSLAGRTDPMGAYATMRNAVVARYADLTAQDPTAKKEFNEARLRQATTDVTGGILDHNGGKIIAPRRGMTQRDFDRQIWGVKDSDLAGATTLDGQALTSQYLLGSAKLETRSDGTYFVKIGSGYAVQYANTESPQKFVLDLRNMPIPTSIGADAIVPNRLHDQP